MCGFAQYVYANYIIQVFPRAVFDVRFYVMSETAQPSQAPVIDRCLNIYCGVVSTLKFGAKSSLPKSTKRRKRIDEKNDFVLCAHNHIAITISHIYNIYIVYLHICMICVCLCCCAKDNKRVRHLSVLYLLDVHLVWRMISGE